MFAKPMHSSKHVKGETNSHIHRRTLSGYGFREPLLLFLETLVMEKQNESCSPSIVRLQAFRSLDVCCWSWVMGLVGVTKRYPQTTQRYWCQ